MPALIGTGWASALDCRRSLLAFGKEIIDQVAEASLLGQLDDGLPGWGRDPCSALISLNRLPRAADPIPQLGLIQTQPLPYFFQTRRHFSA